MFAVRVTNNVYLFYLCVIDHDTLSWIVWKLAVKCIWRWPWNIWVYRVQLYTNLNDVRLYACLFYRRSWEEWTEHISFYLHSISTFFWTWLLTVHQCSRKTTSLWHLTLLISQTNVNIWRYLRSCITKRAQYLRVLACEVQPIFYIFVWNMLHCQHC
jgi:hypothetical protein